ncbi:MAG: hypothetical protein KDD66_18635, partial [Bdellovibrionales bacterium]|nr:hypothetical protein [Bdellovibrionales bacterium]
SWNASKIVSGMSLGSVRKFSPASFLLTLLVICGLSLTAAFRILPAHTPLQVELNIRGPHSIFQITAGNAEGVRKADRVVIETGRSEAFTRLRSTLPIGHIGKIEFSPGTRPGDFFIREICISAIDGSKQTLCLRGEALLHSFRPRRDISYFRLVQGDLHVRTAGELPRFESVPELSKELESLSSAGKSSQFLLAAVCSLALLLIFTVHIPPLSFNFDRLLVGPVPKFAGFFSVSVLFAGVFLNVTGSISAITPPFQGTDEPAHLSKYLATFDHRDCGELPGKFSILNEQLRALRHSPTVKFNPQLLTKDIPTASIQPETDACRYNTLYTAMPKLLNRTFAEAGALDLFSIRSAFSWSAALGFLSCLALIFYGVPLSWLSESEVIFFRLAAIVTVIQTAFLPQMLWLSSTLSQDYALILSGLFLALSLGLRINIFSDIIFVMCLVCALSKGIYLPAFAALVILHYSFVFASGPSLRSVLACAGASIAAFAAAGLALSSTYCKQEYCYGIDKGGLFSDSASFLEELRVMLVEFRVMSFPESFYSDSAFGLLGWLDAPMRTADAVLYSAPLTISLLIAAISFSLLHFPRRETKLKMPSTGYLCSVFCLHWMLSLIAVYSTFLIMQQWCGEQGFFGCGYQRRYELPLYPPFVLGVFFLALNLCSRLFAQSEVTSVGVKLFFVILTFQVFVSAESYQKLLSTLEERYYQDGSEQNVQAAVSPSLEQTTNSGNIP